MNVSRQLALFAVVALAAACSSGPAVEAPASESESPSSGAPAAAAGGSGGRRVFFIEPQDGATVKSPVHLRFGIENYEIAPVPEGTVETVRPGIAHHHVGIDVDCLPPDTEIVRGTPSWVHFGDGKNEIEMQLTPGPHKLTLQAGDDLHRTIEGLCSTINVTVAE